MGSYSDPKGSGFADSRSTKLQALHSALTAVQEVISLPQLNALITIALEPGISINGLAERISIPQQSVSRYVAMLLGRYENGFSAQSPTPLIEQRLNTDDPRRRALFVNENGWRIIDSFIVDSTTVRGKHDSSK